VAEEHQRHRFQQADERDRFVDERFVVREHVAVLEQRSREARLRVN
jgi:hypothetical protein